MCGLSVDHHLYSIIYAYAHAFFLLIREKRGDDDRGIFVDFTQYSLATPISVFQSESQVVR